MARRTKRPEATGVTVALIYTRVSTSEQAANGLSLDEQLQACRKYAAAQEWVLGTEHQDIMSGKRDDRPAYRALLTEASRLADEGRRVAVVVARLDRFGRRLMERVRAHEEFKAAGIAIHSVKEGQVTGAMAHFMAVLAEEEVTRLAARVSDVRKHSQQQGWHVSGRCPWGFRWRTATPGERAAGAPKSVIEHDPLSAPYVTEALTRIAAGEPLRSVALWASRLPEDIRGGRTLAISTLRQMFEGRSYIGEAADGTRGNWQPLVDRATWDAVQAKIDGARGRSGPSNGRHLLTGLVMCPRCGGSMAGQVQGGRWRRYRCNQFCKGGERAARDCGGNISAAPVDDHVLMEIQVIIEPVLAADSRVRAALAKRWERLRKPVGPDAQERRRLRQRAERDAADARRRLADGAKLLLDGVLSRSAYDALAEQEQRRLDTADEILAQPETAPVAPTLPPLDEALAALRDWRMALAEGSPLRKVFLRALIRSVEVHRTARAQYRTIVHWTDLGVALDALREPAAA